MLAYFLTQRTSQDFDAKFDCKRNRTKSRPEFETVVSLGRFSKLRELSGLSPVEFSTVYHNATDCDSVAADPFRGTVHDNISSKSNGFDDIS